MTTVLTNNNQLIELNLHKAQGLAKLDESFNKAELAGAVANTAYGKLIQKAIDEVAQAIKDQHAAYFKAAKSTYGIISQYMLESDIVGYNKKTKQFKYDAIVDAEGQVVESHLNNVKFKKLALIGLTACLNHTFSATVKDKLLVSVMKDVGEAVITEALFSAYQEANPVLFNAVWEHNMKDPLFGVGHAAKSMGDYLQDKLELPANKQFNTVQYTTVLKLGHFIINAVMDMELPLFEVVDVNGIGKLVNSTELLDADMAVAAKLLTKQAFKALPLLVEPKPWTETTPGGYHLNGVQVQHELVSSKHGLPTGNPGNDAIDMLNHLQNVATKVNTEVLEIANALKDKGVSLGAFIVPNKATMSHVEFIKAVRSAVNCQANLEAANLLAHQQQLFTAWKFDWRGRMYPLTSLLIAQSTDFGKSLIKFAESGAVTPAAVKWLAYQVANTFGNGIDKLPLDQKVEWVANCHESISDLAADPVNFAMAWVDGTANGIPDEPWQFIAACLEYHACVIAKTKDTTDLPVASDATCSGLQILTALTLDEQGAAEVNVIGNPNGPADAYTKCAKLAVGKVDEIVAALTQPKGKKASTVKITDEEILQVKELLSGKNARKIAKKVVMTTPYNAGQLTQKNGIEETLADLGIEATWIQAMVMAGSLRAALTELMPVAIEAMQAISEAVYEHSKANNTVTMSWHTPSNFEVQQHKPKQQLTKVKLTSSNLYVVHYKQDLSNGEAAKHKSGTAPNLIHSLDSAVLHVAFANFNKPFSLIHDSVLTLAGDMDDAIKSIKTAFVEIFSHDVLGAWAEEVGIGADVIPPKGTLDINAVMDSEYFFS